jgi:hypothetical protein
VLAHAEPSQEGVSHGHGPATRGDADRGAAHLREAKSLVDQTHDERRDVQAVLQGTAKCISSTRREFEKFVPRRPNWTIEEDTFRPKRRSDEANLEPPPPRPPPPPEPPER